MVSTPPATEMMCGDDVPRSWVKPYYRSFDGLRAVAVFSVFWGHYIGFYNRDPLQLRHLGWMGVDLFFVLSGFLITGILYDSLHQPRFFHNFYVRRALRIFPIFYGFFLILFIATPILHLQWHWSLLEFFFYIGNLTVPFYNLPLNNPTLILSGLPGHVAQPVCNIGHLWSLCVEEQFYFIWPAVIWLVRGRKKLLKLSVALILATVVLRSFLRIHLNSRIGEFPLFFYWSTYMRWDTLLVGACMALWLRGVKLTRYALRRISFWLIFVPALIFFPSFMWSQYKHPGEYFLSNPFLTTIGITLLALAFAGLLMRSLDETGALSRFLQMRPIRAFGTISYGFYFFHALPVVLLGRVAEAHPAWSPALPVLAFIGTTAAAALSFRFYEAPFLRLKSRLAPGHKSVPSGRETLELSERPT